jgi:hypothetical protein
MLYGERNDIGASMHLEWRAGACDSAIASNGRWDPRRVECRRACSCEA